MKSGVQDERSMHVEASSYMASSRTMAVVISSLFFFSSHASYPDDFLLCLSASIPSQLLFTQSSPSFTRLLASSVRNPRFLTPGTVRPLGIVLSWKVKLVPVPPTVTVFTVAKSAEEGAVDIVAQWQEVAPALPDDLFVRAILEGRVARFQSLYLGTCDELLPVMRRRFPALDVTREHCKEMTWLQSVAQIYLGAGASVEDILNRTDPVDGLSSKATSDYVRRAIPRDTWAEILTSLLARPYAGLMILDPYGGKIARVRESASPFPHRGGVLYNVQYMNFWKQKNVDK